MGLWCAQMNVGDWVLMITFWVALVGLVVWAVSRLFPGNAASDPRAVLEKRLASGEIDPEAYRLIRTELDRYESAEAKGN